MGQDADYRESGRLWGGLTRGPAHSRPLPSSPEITNTAEGPPVGHVRGPASIRSLAVVLVVKGRELADEGEVGRPVVEPVEGEPIQRRRGVLPSEE